MSTGFNVTRKAVGNLLSKNYDDAWGMTKKVFGRQWRHAQTRSGQQALVARAAVGAIGGGAYGYTQGDWKSGAMRGAGLGAGYYMAGGTRGMGLIARKGGFMQKSAAKAAATKTAGKEVGQKVAQKVTTTGARAGRWDNVGWVQNAKQRQAEEAAAAATARQAEVRRIRRTAGSADDLMAQEFAAHQRAMAGAAQRRGSLNQALNAEHNADYTAHLNNRRLTSASQQKRSRKLRGRRG